MFKYILVPSTGSDTDAPVFDTALAVARLGAAHLEFLHVRVDVQQTMMAMAGVDVGLAEVIDALERETAARQQKAETAFREFCEREQLPVAHDPGGDGPSAEWRVATGDEATWLAEHGRAADLLVAGRDGEGNGEAIAMDRLEACLMASGRPLLIAAGAAPRSLTGTVAIAWKDSSDAARAVAAARPFLERASRVIILMVDEGEPSQQLSAERLRQALRWHKVDAFPQLLRPQRRPPAETLLAGARDVGADLLVMGGYGHSRAREVVFGGFTRHLLAAAEVPILMAH